VEGGSANDYDYANADPINNLDLAGTCVMGKFGNHCKHGLTLRGALRGVAFVTATAGVVVFVAGTGGLGVAGTYFLVSAASSGTALGYSLATHSCKRSECTADGFNAFSSFLPLTYAGRIPLIASKSFAALTYASGFLLSSTPQHAR
jgi:hypothetical protein